MTAAVRLHPLGAADMNDLAVALADAGLPTGDLTHAGRRFWRAGDDAAIGFAGIEGRGDDRLLRSVVVAPTARGYGRGAAMLTAIEDEARRDGARRLHLLTTTAAAFFRARGYTDAARADAPPAIAATAEFARLCPGSAAYLVKSL